jgi:hypothetical protein
LLLLLTPTLRHKSVILPPLLLAEQLKYGELRYGTLSRDLKVEFCLMFGEKGQVLVAPNNMALFGQSFDPGFVVSDTLKTGLKHIRT